MLAQHRRRRVLLWRRKASRHFSQLPSVTAALVMFLLIGAIIITLSMAQQQSDTNVAQDGERQAEAVATTAAEKAQDVLNPLLEACGRGDALAKQLEKLSTDDGRPLCGAAAQIKADPVIADPRALLAAPPPPASVTVTETAAPTPLPTTIPPLPPMTTVTVTAPPPAPSTVTRTATAPPPVTQTVTAPPTTVTQPPVTQTETQTYQPDPTTVTAEPPPPETVTETPEPTDENGPPDSPELPTMTEPPPDNEDTPGGLNIPDLLPGIGLG